MCSAIITRNIFIVNAVHTVLQDLLLPPGSTKIVSCYNWWAGTLILVLWIFMHKLYMNMNKFCMNTHEFAWTCINFTWTCINFAWTCMKVDQKFRVCSRYLGHVTSVWNRHPNFCGSVWRPYYSTQNMWNSFTSIINTYTSIYLYATAPSLKKCNFCHEQIYLSLVGKGLIMLEDLLCVHTHPTMHRCIVQWVDGGLMGEVMSNQ